MQPVEIHTERLFLRAFQPADTDSLHLHWRDHEVRRYLWDNREVTREMAAEAVTAAIHSASAGGPVMYTVRISGACAGCCGLRAGERGETELMYSLSPAFWGQGIATEASRSVLASGFRDLKLPRIYGRTDLPNERSAAVLQRLGMKFVRQFESEGLTLVEYVITPDQMRI